MIGAIILLTISCKKEENENPTIRFLQPDLNLIIASDTVITFIVEPHDNDGTISKVEFKNNGAIVQTIVSPPYEYDWNITTEDNIGIYSITAIAYDNHGALGESEIQIEIQSYLAKWVSDYEGISHHWLRSPEYSASGPYIEDHYYKKVQIKVFKSSIDSCLNFLITYNDSIIDEKNNLKFSVLGTHFSHWGWGSGYGFLKVNIDRDSLHYNYYQKCGIPCSSRIDYVIARNN